MSFCRLSGLCDICRTSAVLFLRDECWLGYLKRPPCVGYRLISTCPKDCVRPQRRCVCRKKEGCDTERFSSNNIYRIRLNLKCCKERRFCVNALILKLPTDMMLFDELKREEYRVLGSDTQFRESPAKSNGNKDFAG